MNPIAVVAFQSCKQTCRGVYWGGLVLVLFVSCPCRALFGWKKRFLDVGQCVTVNVQEVARTLQVLTGNETLGWHSLALKRKGKSRFMSE